jgi:O-methyltransferase
MINILKRALTGTIYNEELYDKYISGDLTEDEKTKILSTGIEDSYVNDGRVIPTKGETMLGLPRLNNFQWCIEQAIANEIEGDIIETGVWKGGACILAAAVVRSMESRKIVFVADSFEGLPKPEDVYPEDANDPHHTIDFLKVSLSEVKQNFAKYGLLNNQVIFIEGFFKDTLPDSPQIEKLSVLRLDGDMYSSTIEVLEALYDKLSVGGYLIVDDFFLPACRKAVEDFREKRNITDEIVTIDWTGVYWIKTLK